VRGGAKLGATPSLVMIMVSLFDTQGVRGKKSNDLHAKNIIIREREKKMITTQKQMVFKRKKND